MDESVSENVVEEVKAGNMFVPWPAIAAAGIMLVTWCVALLAFIPGMPFSDWSMFQGAIVVFPITFICALVMLYYVLPKKKGC